MESRARACGLSWLVSLSRRKPELRCKALRPGLGGDQTVIAALGRDCKPFGIHELDVGDPDEAEKLAHELGLRVVVAVEAAARRENVRLFAGEQAHRAFLGVFERLAGAREV